MRSPLIFLALLASLVLTNATAETNFPQVKIDTASGVIVVELNRERAPITVANFLQYVNDKFYDGTIFHRVISGFVVQGGGFNPELELKPTRDSIVNESGNGLSNKRMSIAMARSGEAHSGDSQFYFNLADNTPLDPKPTRWGYTVFGEVIEGFDIVDGIGHQATSPKGAHQNLPAVTIMIKSMAIVNEASE